MDIRRFFAPKPGRGSSSTEEEPKSKKKPAAKVKSSASDAKPPAKRRPRVIADSDSDEDEAKDRKSSSSSSSKGKPAAPGRKDPVTYLSDSDSDDAFASLKKPPRLKENGRSEATKGPQSTAPRSKEVKSAPVRSPETKGAPPKKALGPTPTKPVTPKRTPTSVMDYFGTSDVQRSDKKLVASAKRKAPTQDPDDEAIARQLQADDDMELEKQIHEDEAFARTLAASDDAPLPKKARVDPTTPSKSGSKADAASPAKASSKLAMMKRRAEQEEEEQRRGVVQITPKKEPAKRAPSEKAATPKSAPAPGGAGGGSKSSPTKPETSPEDKKRANSAAFRSYLNRDGPRALGSKEIPQGEENCLEGCVFVLTGVLESMERDEARSLIERYGGKVTGNVSRKTAYLVLGRDGGASKTDKAQSLGTTVLTEDQLLDLIGTRPGKRSKYELAAEAQAQPTESRTPPSKSKRTPPGEPPSAPEAKKGLELGSGNSDAGHALLWVDKYRPRSLKNLIGQQGEQSCANKLMRWLRNWHRNHGAGAKPAGPRFGKFGGKDDGSGFRAALLSGPPGVGKTTTAALVCEELGYSYVEMNASCTRSKNSLKQVVAESLNNTSIKNFYTGASQTVSDKHVLIMDEVDGMAGNEDRGGIQEMIGLIKQSRIPIICMCNDRNHQKIRSLANYCYDLRFQRPRVEQIKGAMMSIAFKEGLKIPPPALNEVILASNQDVRQVLHNLSMWSATDKVMTYDRARADALKARKDVRMGPFDVCRKVFAAGEETASMTLTDKSDLFFHDYSLAPLFVQENYVHVRPAAAGGNMKNHLVLLSKTADSIADGDLVDKQIRSRQAWSLLPTQAVYASVLPGELMRGYMSHFPAFPSWLGRFSSTGRHGRAVQELVSHMSLRTLGGREAVNLDYLPYLRSALLEPLRTRGPDGVARTVRLMDDYNIVKEDFDSIMEIGTWAGQDEPYSRLDPKVKAAFTRTYNKESHMTPYSLQPVKKGRRGAAEPEPGLDADAQGRDDEEEEGEEETVATDAMIKQKKSKASRETKRDRAADSTKGKGKGRK